MGIVWLELRGLFQEGSPRAQGSSTHFLLEDAQHILARQANKLVAAGGGWQ
jgi:hypothetical protein